MEKESPSTVLVATRGIFFWLTDLLELSSDSDDEQDPSDIADNITKAEMKNQTTFLEVLAGWLVIIAPFEIQISMRLATIAKTLLDYASTSIAIDKIVLAERQLRAVKATPSDFSTFAASLDRPMPLGACR